MLEKPKRPTKPKIQDRLQPTTVEELIKKYDLENKGVYDFLDKMVDYINNKNSIMEVGDIFLTTNSTNPGTRFGGTWELIAKGRTLVGLDENDEDFNEVGKTGGSKYLQKHSHNVQGSGIGKNIVIGDSTWGWSDGVVPKSATNGGTHIIATETGSGNSENLQPYFVCYIWKRIA